MPKDEKIAAIERRIEKLRELQERLIEQPEDDFEDEAVIVFKKRFTTCGDGSTSAYTYAAIKIKGRWYVTGTSQAKLTWEELLDFIGDGAGEPVWYATEWDELVIP